MKADYFLVADAVQMYESGKLVIVGTFQRIYMQELPGFFRPFGVAGQLKPDRRDRGRESSLELRLRRRGSRKPILVASFQMSRVPQKEPDTGVVAMMIGPVRFESAGRHILELYDAGHGSTICETTIDVVLREPDKKKPSRALAMLAGPKAKKKTPAKKKAGARGRTRTKC